MASSSSSSAAAAAAASATNDRNRVVDHNPPPAVADPPPPEALAFYLHQLYRQAEPRRPLVSAELPFFCRALSWGFLVFLGITSFVVLIWLIFHPTFPRLHVASAAMSTVATTAAAMSTVATTAAAATAECNITLLLTNPNRHLTAMYDRMEISLLYPSQQVLLSQDYLPPFLQPKKSRIAIETNLNFNGINLGSDVIKAMKQDLDRGSLSLGIKILAMVRYRNGKWKTKSQFMRAYCGGVSFAFTSSNKPGIFLNPYQECEVYVYSK